MRDALDLGEDVRGDEHRELLRQRAHELAQLDDLARVEPVRRLVEHEQPGLPEQRLRDRHALPVAARQAADRRVEHVREREPLHGRVDRALQRGALEAAHPSHEARGTRCTRMWR